MPIAFDQIVPVLRMFSVEDTKAFYVGFLGLSVDWEHRFEPDMPLYLQVSRAGLTLHLSEHHGDSTPGGVVFVRMRGLAAFHAEINAKGYKYMRPGLEIPPWNPAAQLMEVIDPSGNRIRFEDAGATEQDGAG